MNVKAREWNPLAGLPRHFRIISLVLASGLMGLLALGQMHFRLILVVGPSMLPTFNTGHVLLVHKRAYRDADPRRGDTVVARYNKDLIVKRVVALPWEQAEVNRGTLYIDGTPIEEDHPINPGPLDIGRGRLPKGKFALLGDNRALPASQIVHAIVSKEHIVGKVVFSVRLSRSEPRPIPGT